MIFLEALQSATGWGAGLCVWLVAWLFLKAAAYRILGITEALKEDREFSAITVRALMERNALTQCTNELLERIERALVIRNSA